MSWPKDDSKLNRVRALMKDQDVSALVVRAPDNVLYLTNYWCMKGYDAVVFPQEGDPTLIVLEPQLADAQRNSWTKDLKLFKGYDERDARPAPFRSLDLALETLKQRGLTDKVAVELNMGTQSADRMVGEPTTPTQFFFDAFRKVSGQVVDATPFVKRSPCDQDVAGNRAHAIGQRTRSLSHGLYPRTHEAGHEGKRSRRHVREFRARAWRRVQGQGRDGAGLHAGLVREGNCDFHRHWRPP